MQLQAIANVTFTLATSAESARKFFEGFDHTALGYLHCPQCVAGNEAIRYSGSPIPLGSSEAVDSKSNVMFDLAVLLTRPLVRMKAKRAAFFADLAQVPSGA